MFVLCFFFTMSSYIKKNKGQTYDYEPSVKKHALQHHYQNQPLVPLNNYLTLKYCNSRSVTSGREIGNSRPEFYSI